MSSAILEVQAINSMNNDVLGFSKPMFNDIRIISPEKLLLDVNPTYYGDTVNLKFWKAINIKIGKTTANKKWELTTDYLYVYNHTKEEFTVYDNTNSLIFTKSNIKSIADMDISFNIYKSHQFKILIESGDKSLLFFIPTLANMLNWHQHIEDVYRVGINNICTSDEERPYGSDNPNNPSYTFYKLSNSLDDYYISKKYSYSIHIYDESIIGALYKILNTDSILIGNNLFINDGFKINVSTKRWSNFKSRVIDISYVLSYFTLSLYPNLMPILQEGETQNNRPLYENWLIYGKYSFKYNYIKYDSYDTLYLDVFDLSPNWG